MLFTAHSLPQRIIDAGDPYPDELRATAEAVAAELGLGDWSRWAIAWQSAGRTPEPWLGPDILQVIDELAASEHHARQAPTTAWACSCARAASSPTTSRCCTTSTSRPPPEPRALGLAFDRTACVNDDPAVMAALAARVIAAS